ncbi:FAD-binding domain-containing protein 1 [Elsinoe australis]|uniref:FAD-binding domain-containing protein 1 n=1 Tax=Elsinoe australis TaxID=40998 RepID=A0A4U7BEY8_9PEZI|nr:FAD-binding domain-containing protein 1 [Elsinoe australis]
MSGTFKKVIVVGAGPSGLLLAIMLAKKGISVEVVEASHELDQQPRAAHYGPAAMPDLRRAGVLDEIRRRGLTLNTMCWRNYDDHTVMTGINNDVLADVDGEDQRTTCLVLNELDAFLQEEFENKYNGKVSFKHKVTGIGQDENKAWVDVETPEGSKKMEADYIIGCDGANSQVRRSLFGDLNYPGKTWDNYQIVATNTYYDFKKLGWQDANFIIHPEHFYMVAVLNKEGLYRITYGEEPGLSREQLQERMAWKFKTMLPGHPDPDQYKVVNFSPYKMHQRCAEKFRVGRFMLCADAAHLCSPWGGMGISSGFVDVGGLYDCLAGIWDGVADEDILDLYSAKRIEKYKTIVDPISSENFRRVHDADPRTRLERDEFMQLCVKAETDKDLRRNMLMGGMDLRYDFTQHYKDKKGTKGFKDESSNLEKATNGVPQPVS